MYKASAGILFGKWIRFYLLNDFNTVHHNKNEGTCIHLLQIQVQMFKMVMIMFMLNEICKTEFHASPLAKSPPCSLEINLIT